jgi:integral membrane protein
MAVDSTTLRRLRFLSLSEGTSTLILFGAAMPLKYWADMPLAVSIAGSVHGFLFVSLVIYAWFCVKKVPISAKTAFALSVAAVFPFGPFVVDRRLRELE